MTPDAPAGPWLAPFAARLAALAPLGPTERLMRLDRWAREAGLVTDSGRALRFVAADDQPARGGAPPPAYERRIFEAGEVATRTAGPGVRHDLYNALAWLAFPRAKARLNALHAQAIGCAAAPTAGAAAPTAGAAAPIAGAAAPTAGAAASTSGAAAPSSPVPPAPAPAPAVRGPLRDAATLFDENGALWIGLDADLEAALRAFDWRRLFVVERERLACAVRVSVFGHALLEKLDAPYKAVTAHAWPLRLPPGATCAEADEALARALDPGRLSSRALCPLPVMGLPGWCEANRDPAFYNDAAVFRAGRRQATRPAQAADSASHRPPRD